MKKINEKLFIIQSKGLKFKKTADNPFFHSKYLPLDELIETLLPILTELRLLITHSTHEKYVVTSVIDVDSDELISSAFPIPEGLEPQKVGSVITYAKRYNLSQIFNILSDEDDDSNASATPQTARHEVLTPKTTQYATPAQKPSLGTQFCPACKIDAVISKKTGNQFCPNWKNHEKGVYISLVPKPTKNEIDFGASLDNDIDAINAGL